MYFVDMFWFLINLSIFYNVVIQVAIYNKLHVKVSKTPCKIYIINPLCPNDN